MAYNRKMRKFEGTCYIPGEQLAMMAKYYRGANLNLNLTLFEDDLSTLQETLDQACWCSKLDEVDRMKMSHMKGNEWRIAHDHCLEQAGNGPDERNPTVYPALPQRSRSTIVKVERGTSAVSLYDRERGFMSGGRYQRDGSEPRSRRDDYYDRPNRRSDYNGPRNHRGYYSDPRRDDCDMPYRRGDPGPSAFHAQMSQNGNRTGRHTGGPPEQRYDMGSEPAMSSMPEDHGDVRCAVCNVETCLVCKNHLYSPIFKCKCPVANAGLCNRCNQEPCEEEEEEPVVQETGGNKTDLSSMMMTMMMSSMFKQAPAPESVCCCKPSRDNSDGSSSESSEGKIHKVYLYDCDDTKKNKKSRKKSKKASSESSSACDCCKCSRKPKRSSGKKEKRSKTGDDETSDSDEGQKHQSTKGKGSKDVNRKSKGGDSNLESDVKPVSNRKSPSVNNKSSKSSKEEDAISLRSENLESSKMKDEDTASTKAVTDKTSIDSKNVQFSNARKSSTKGAKKPSSTGSDVSKRSPSPRKSPPAQRPEAQISELLDTQDNVPDPESSNRVAKEGDTEGVAEESSMTFSLREFVVCLPKIQSNLQTLMDKLNQMDHLNNQLQCPRIDPATANRQYPMLRPDVPLISPAQNPLPNTSGSLYNEPQLYHKNQKPESEIRTVFSPSNTPAHNFPPAISTCTLHAGFDPPTMHHSTVNFSNLGEIPEPVKATADDWKQLHPLREVVESTNQTPSTFKFSPLGGEALTKDNIGKNGNQRSNRAQSTLCTFSPGSFPHNVEIIELPEVKPSSERSNRSRKYIGATAATTSSQCGGETIFQSYNRETSADTSEQSLTDYASFSDEKHFELSPAASAKQLTIARKKNIEEKPAVGKSGGNSNVSQKHGDCSIISKYSRSNREGGSLHKTRSVFKASKRVSFKAKIGNPPSLEKLVQGCTVRGAKGSQERRKSNAIREVKADFKGKSKMKLLDQGVGPGKFRRSKSDSSLDNLSENTVKDLSSSVRPNIPSKHNETYKARKVTPMSKAEHNEFIPSKRPGSPVKEKARCTVAAKKEVLLPKMRESAALGKTGFKNTPSDSMFKMSDAYVRKEVGSQSYIVSSVEVKTINNYGSSTDILKLVQGITSSSHTNVTNVSSVHQSVPTGSEDFDILPLLPLSSAATTNGSDTRNENQSGAVVQKKTVSFEDEVTPNTPGFLRKSRLQVEQLKRAHETIRSMIKNVNEVIAHIDSDSQIGIKSKARNEDKERQSYFVHLGSDDGTRQSHYKPRDVASDSKPFDRQDEAASSSEPPCSTDKQNRDVQKMFVTVDRLLNSVLTPSDQSSGTPEGHWPSENTSPGRAHRDYFILNSDSNSTAFTESLRRSLENEDSRSVPLATQTVPSPQHGSSQRPRSTRPLKRRSWFPSPKK